MSILSRAWDATVVRLADRFEAENVEAVQSFERATGTPHWCRLPDGNGHRIGDENDSELWTAGWRAAAASPTELDR